jgi:orotate phosphoribosyltransferase
MSDEARDFVIDYLKSMDSFWQWDGHANVAKMTSGNYTDVFANCSPFLEDVVAQDKAAEFLLSELLSNMPSGLSPMGNVWFVGSAMGAVGLPQSLARHVARGVGHSAFAEPIKDHCTRLIDAIKEAVNQKFGEQPFDCVVTQRDMSNLVDCFIKRKPTKLMGIKRFDMGEAPYVILVEDVVSTGGTTELTMEGVKRAYPDARFCPYVLTIVDRSTQPLHELAFNRGYCRSPGIFKPLHVLSLLRLQPRVWGKPEGCPKELEGLPAIRPKENWTKLTTEKL